MKKLFYLFVALMISQNLLAVDKTWTGATSTAWATASNWSPSGAPASGDFVYFHSATTVVISTNVTITYMYLTSGVQLTINSGGTLNVSNTPNSVVGGIENNGTIINNGTLNILTPNCCVSAIVFRAANASLTNNGTATFTNTSPSLRLAANNTNFTNTSTGVVTINAPDFGILDEVGISGVTCNNQGTINFNGTGYFMLLRATTVFTNSGTVNVSNGSGISNQTGTVNNQNCGKILLTAGGLENSSTTTNSGFIQTAVLQNTGSFTNNSGGVLKYNSLTGTITNNNGSAIVNNNATNSTIFTYQGTFTGTVNGIFTNATATTSAGTYTQSSNTFVPSGTLPTGSQTLYAKITPNSGACNYVVPFTYNNVIPPSITTSGTLSTFSTCSGTASSTQSFTVSGANLTANIIINAPTGFEVATSSGGTYSSSLTLTRSGTSVANTSIFVRLKSTATGTTSGNVTCTSTGATTRNVAASGTVTNSPTLTVGTTVNPTTCGGTNGSIAFTTTNLPNGTYSLSFTSAGTGATASPQNITVASNAFSLTGLKAGSYNNFTVTNAGCTGTTGTLNPAKVVADPATPTLIAGTVTNPTTCGGTGVIAFTSTNLPNGTYTLNYTLNGTATSKSITVASNAFSLTGLLAGSYNTFSVTNAGCTGTTGTLTPAKTVTNPATPTLTAGTVTNPTTCGGTGVIAFTSTNLPNGTYTLNYTLNGTATSKSITVVSNAFSLTGLLAGSYNTFSATNAGCTGTTGTLTPAKTVADPASPTLTAGTVTSPFTCGGTGSIAFTSTNLPNGTYTLNYTLNGTATSKSITVASNAFSLTGLLAGSYNDFSVTNAGCTGTTGTLSPAKTVFVPAAPTLIAGAATNSPFCGGIGSIAFTSTNLPNGTYTLNYTFNGTATSKSITVGNNVFSLTGLLAGSYNDFSVTNNGCTGTTGTLSPAKIIADPATPTLTAGAITQPTTCGGAGSIAFTSTNLPNGTYTLNYTFNGTATSKSITVSGNAFSLASLLAGSYNDFSVTNNGCTGTTGTLSPAKIIADPAKPTLTAGAITQPTTCGGPGSIAFTSTNLPNGTYTLNYTLNGTTRFSGISVSGNAFSLGGILPGSYNDFSVTNNGCTGTTGTLSPAKIIADPATPTLTAGAITQPTTCAGTGSIAFTSTNLPNGTYSLSFTPSVGATTSPKSITVSSNAFSLTGLKAGTYSNFSVTNAGCTGSTTAARTVADPASPTITIGAATNPTTCGGNGFMTFTSTNLPNGTYSLTFTATGTGATISPQSITVSGNAFSLTGLKAGTYSNFSVTNAGCTGSTTDARNISDPIKPTITPGIVTNTTTCGGSEGTIQFTSTGIPNGTNSITFTATGTGATTSPQSITVSGNAFSLTGLKAGGYSNFSVTNVGCTGTSALSREVAGPATPTISAGTVVNPSTCGATGSIPFTATNLPNGTYSLSFTATGTGATSSPRNVVVNNNSFSLTGLSVGSYSNFSLTSAACVATDATSKTIANPTTPTLVAGTAVNPTSCGGTDGSIPFTTNLPDGTYSLSYTGTGSPKSITVSSGAFNLGSLGSGAYSNFSVTNNGCVGTASTSKSLNDPAAPVLTLGTTTNPSACNLADGSIAFTVNNIANGTYSLAYAGAGNPKSVSVNSNAFTLNGLADGVYSNFSITNENGCTGSLSNSVTLVDLALPVLTVGTSTNPTTCTGTQGTIAFTSANLPDGTYALSFTSTGTASPQNITVASNAFTLNGLSAGTYSNFSVTRLGCTGSVSTSKTLVDPATPTLTAGASANPTTCAGTDGSIAFTSTNLANGTYSLSFTSTGTTSPKNVVVTNNTFTLSTLIAGNYSNFSITNNGCTATEATAKTLSDPPSITLVAGTSTNPTTCSGTDGSINFTTTNLPDGNYTLTYTGAGSPQTVTVSNNTFSISGLSAGAYSNFSITYLGCVGSDSQTKTLTDPASATLTAGTVTNPSTCNGTNGSIAFTSTNLPNGNYSLTYTGAGSPQTVTVSNNAFTLTGLSAGDYSNFSLISNGCTTIETTVKSLVAPSIATLVAGTVTNPSTCSGTDGSIAFTTSLANGTYSIAYTGANSPQNITVTNGAFTLNGLASGVYANFSIVSNGCTSTDETSKTLVDPNTPTLTAGTTTNPSTCNGTDGSIAFTTSLVDGTYSLVYTGAGSPRTITVTSGAFTLTGLQDGVYANFSITSNGCVSLAATSKTLVDPATPTLTAGTVTNPSVCSGTDGKIAFTTSLPNGTYSLNFSGSGSPKNITVANGAFELTGLSSGTYSGFSVSTNGCTGTYATAVSLTDPAAPSFTAGTVTNPTTCSSSDGKIAFTTNLPNGTYTLNYTGTGSPKSITVVSGVFELTNLPDGTFSGFSITVNGCTGTDATIKTLTDPAAPTLTAGTTTNPSTCSSTDGSIAFTTSLPNGTYTLNYTGTGSPKSITVVNGAFTLTGLPNGIFSGFSVIAGGCTGISSASITLTDPTAPTITAGTITNPSACNGTNGSIAFTTTLPNGDYTLNYTGSGSPKTITVVSGAFTLSGLPAGDYSGFSVSIGGCIGIDNTNKTIVNPNPPTLTVGTATNPSTCSGTGSIDFTTNLPNGTYNLTYTGNGSPKSVTITNGAFTLSGLLVGTYSDFSIDNNNGCVGTDATSKTLSDPIAPTITAGVVTNPTICNGNDGSIAFTTNLPNGTYSLDFTGTGSPKNVIVSNGTFSLTGLSAGTYSNFSVTNNGCTGSDATTKNLSDPLAPSALISGSDNLNCSLTSVLRTASGGTSYLWSNDLGTNASVTITAAGTYTVTVTLNGCTATATTDVTFTNNLVASASNSGPYRVGNTIELNATGGANYAWNGPNNFVSTSQNPTISGALAASAGIYTVTVSTGACSATATTNVVIDALLDPCTSIIDYQFVKVGNPYQPLFNLTNGMAINQITDPVSIIAVPICPTSNIESLLMKLQGPNMNEEIIQNVSPYTIFDNTGNSINGRVLAPGVYTLTITGYNQDNLLGGINYGPVVTTFTILPNAASISTPTVSKTTLCVGSTLDVTFSISGTFNPANQFKVELSNANGNFGSVALLGNTTNSATFIYPTLIGISNSSGVISCTIPATLEGGINYRIRVISTDGVSVSQVNSIPITIHPKDLNLVSPTDDFSTNIGTKQASNKVTASNKISATANVNYQAGKAIILNAGFEANAGTVFKAEIGGCNN